SGHRAALVAVAACLVVVALSTSAVRIVQLDEHASEAVRASISVWAYPAAAVMSAASGTFVSSSLTTADNDALLALTAAGLAGLAVLWVGYSFPLAVAREHQLGRAAATELASVIAVFVAS